MRRHWNGFLVVGLLPLMLSASYCSWAWSVAFAWSPRSPSTWVQALPRCSRCWLQPEQAATAGRLSSTFRSSSQVGSTARRAFFEDILQNFLPDRAALKAELLDLVAGSKRGSDVSKQKAITKAFEALEKVNECNAPVQSELLRGDWELLWTTSDSILGQKRPSFFQPSEGTPILQYLDPANGRARNLEYTMLGTNMVEAEIKPMDEGRQSEYVSKLGEFLQFKLGTEEPAGGTYIPTGANLDKNTVAVKFKEFKVLNGLISVPAPETATGILQFTYLDEDLRLSRGDRGNLFVLRRFNNEETMP